jgi:hypothetical protein
MRQKIMVAEKCRSLKIKSFKPNQGCPLAIWSALIVLAMVIVHTTSLLALSSSRPRERHLEQMLANYEIHYYAPEEFSRKVRAAEPVSFNISNREFRFRLAPRDLRSRHYKAETSNSSGQRFPLISPSVESYQAILPGQDGGQARFTLREDSFEGVILTRDEWYFVEPLGNFVPDSSRSDFVLYRRSDLRPEALGACAGTLSHRITRGLDLTVPSYSTSSLSSYIAEIATEADLEFVTALGGANQANTEILNILNQVEGVYQSELGISFSVVYQHTWTAAGPYTSTDPNSMLQEFTDYWNNNFSSTNYDLAHMWTGKDMNGNTVGIAWKDVICFKDYSYGISQHLTGTPAKFIVTAHEMGHNFGASHPDQETPAHSECSDTIMNSMIGSGFTFCQFSRDQINTTLAAGVPCLTQDSTTPSAPSNLSAKAISSSRIDLSWQDNSSDETGFAIQRKTGLDGVYAPLVTTGANVISYSDTGLTEGTTYYYCVQADRSGGNTEFSNEAAATTLLASSLPSISSFTPAGGLAGAKVIISGKNLSGAAIVKFNNSICSFTVDSATQISAYVPAAATTGLISVTTAAGTAFSSTTFQVLSCSYSLSASGESFSSAGGMGSVSISTSDTCSWTAAGSANWITLTSPASGTGSGILFFQVGPNLDSTTRSGQITAAGISYSISQSAGTGGIGSTIFLPIILSSSGMGGTYYSTEMTLTNRGTYEAALDFYYTSSIGSGSGHGTANLPPGRQLLIPNAIDFLRSTGIPIGPYGNQGGTLKVKFSGLSSPSDGAVTVRISTALVGGKAGLAYNGIPSSLALTEPAYLCGLRQNETDRSNLAFQNAGASGEGSITLKITVFTGDPGNPFSRILPLEILPPGGFKQISGILTSNGLNLTDGYVKVERVSGTAPFYSYAVINDQVTSDGSFVAPLTESSLKGKSKLILPVIVESASFSSELIVSNWSGMSRILRCSFVADAVQATGSAATFTLDLQAGEQRILPEIVNWLRSQGAAGIGSRGTTYAGPLYVEASSGDLSGIGILARTSSGGNGGHYGLFYGSLPEGTYSTSTAWIYGLQQNTQSRTNLALINTGEVDGGNSVFKIEIFDGLSGSKVNTLEAVNLKARGWMQFSSLLAQYASMVNQGFVRITQTSGNNPFIAYAVINDGASPGLGTGDGAYLPAMP